MKIATYDCDGVTRIGIVHDDAVLDLASAFGGAAFLPGSVLELIAGGDAMLAQVQEALDRASARRDDHALWRPIRETKFLAPIPKPAKNIFCIGRNYRAHIEEADRARGREVTYPRVPEFFSKPPTAVIGTDADIRLDRRVTKQLDYEVELALIVGRRLRDAKAEDATGCIFGFTVLNDVSARDLQKDHGQWFKGKGLDTFCPIGPWIVTADELPDANNRRIALRVNGETRQESMTSDLLFGFGTILESLCAGMTLEPGDIIATGTPSGVALGMTPQRWLQDGDVVEAEIDGIGILRNRVRVVQQ
jgi:2-keto-4-pentenoate hydratase/2-oxohepta-3-ene-1,7-dioic acid hydratase in catechol pathway